MYVLVVFNFEAHGNISYNVCTFAFSDSTRSYEMHSGCERGLNVVIKWFYSLICQQYKINSSVRMQSTGTFQYTHRQNRINVYLIDFCMTWLKWHRTENFDEWKCRNFWVCCMRTNCMLAMAFHISNTIFIT